MSKTHFDDRNWLSEILQGRNKQEFFNEQLRIEHSDVRGAANKRVGGRGECVLNVVSDESDFGPGQDWREDVVDHFAAKEKQIGAINFSGQRVKTVTYR